MGIGSLRTLVLFLFFIPSWLQGANQILFEGYYKINSGGQHVGYYIQRYEQDPQRKEFISTYFLRTNKAGGNISESLKAHATYKLEPIKYQYTSLQNKTAKTIDANVRQGKRGQSILQVHVNENGRPRVYEKKMRKGTFLSTFLVYLLLQGEKGIQKGVSYRFQAVAEEDGRVFPGNVEIPSEIKEKGMNLYKVVYNFKRSEFVNLINAKGESLKTFSPVLKLSAELVKKPIEATKGINFNEKNLKLLFGNVPAGNIHQLIQSSGSSLPVSRPPSSKKGTQKKGIKNNKALGFENTK